MRRFPYCFGALYSDLAVRVNAQSLPPPGGSVMGDSWGLVVEDQ
jgi:hypothetical protein